MNIENGLRNIVTSELILTNEPMKNHTSFKIGGNADYYVMPETKEQILNIRNFCLDNDIPFYIVGKGSNLLVSDEGLRGVVIKIGRNFSSYSVDGDNITAQSGILLSKLANIALENSLTGFEFASGIPGSLGGAVYMNAGAYDGEIKDVVISTEYIDKNGEIHTVNGVEHDFSYRHSMFSADDIILESTLKFTHGNKDEILSYMRELNNRRKEKQPLEHPSAGSTFKRPEGYFAAKLIDDSGLRGYRIGGAMVSEKHCGFVVNVDNATCDDVLKLMDYIKNVVMKKYGVELEAEVKYLA